MRWLMISPRRSNKTVCRGYMQLQDEIYAKQRQSLLGQGVEVLVEKRSFKDDRFLKAGPVAGKMYYLKAGTNSLEPSNRCGSTAIATKL